MMSLLHRGPRLDRSLDQLAMQTGIRTTRGAILRPPRHVFLK
jgi:hypothetical protein